MKRRLTRRQCLITALVAVVAPVGKLLAGASKSQPVSKKLFANLTRSRSIEIEMEKIYPAYIMSAGRTNTETWYGHPPGTVKITGFKCRRNKSGLALIVTVHYEVKT